MSAGSIAWTEKLTAGKSARKRSSARGRNSTSSESTAASDDVTGLHAAQVIEFGAHALEVEQRIGDVAQQDGAGGREPHAGRQAVEELRAERGLDLQQLAIDGARRDVERRRRAAHRAAPRDLGEIAQR
jgi:hypothetical protein